MGISTINPYRLNDVFSLKFSGYQQQQAPDNVQRVQKSKHINHEACPNKSVYNNNYISKRFIQKAIIKYMHSALFTILFSRKPT